MFAYIPARGGSKRIEGKNLRILGGKPILGHVLENLLKVDLLKGICVSSDDSLILEYASSYASVVTLDRRLPALADDNATFADLIRHDLPRFAQYFGSRDVLFTLPTCPLVSPLLFSNGVKKYFGRQKDPLGRGLVMSVTKFDYTPFLAFKEAGDGTLSTLYPDLFDLPSKDIPGGFYDSGCFYLFDLDEATAVPRLIDLSPVRGIMLPGNVGIDLDSESDWARLERAFQERM